MSEQSSEPEDALIGTILAERYRIEKRLGHGGMGAVYLAEHVRMHKPFAVKVLHKEMSHVSEAVFRFEREAVASGRVDDPHLVSAMDFGELADGSLYLVLEYIPGDNLAHVIAQGPLPVIRALKIARQIAEALAAVHAAGIVHRDVKPDNVMLVARDGEDFVKLLDFGMAKVHMEHSRMQPEVTQAGFVFGTPRYMAPEQASAGRTDHRSDLYSLGVVLYAMLKGEPPFSADDIRDVLRMQRYDPPPALPPEVDAAVAGLVMTLLAKDPSARIQSARAVVEYIDQLLQRVRSPTHRPNRISLRAANVLRTRFGIIGLGTIAVLAFVIGLLLVSRSAKRHEVVSTSAGSAAASASASSTSSVPAPEALLARAEAGEERAWKELESRPDSVRSAREWFVLGEARTQHGDRAAAVDAYLRAAETDKAYSTNFRLLHDILFATDDAKAWEKALPVAAALPGPNGADILFQVWSSTPKATTKTALAKKLLETDGVRSRASPSVLVALDLRDAQGQNCESRLSILSRAAKSADARAFGPLMRLQIRKGCGPKQRDDCFPCLRRSDLLDRAIEMAQQHSAPDFSKPHAPVGQ